jgi:hypothetical protein
MSMKTTKLFLMALLIVAISLSACSTTNDSLSPYTPGEDSSNQDSSNDDSNDNSEIISRLVSVDILKEEGASVHCTFQGEYEGIMVSHDLYVDDNRLKVYTTQLIDGQQQESNMIMDDTHMYVWSSESPMAMKMSLDLVNEANDEDVQTTDTAQEFPYECTSWKPSKSSFVPPSDIEFVDFDSIFLAFSEMSFEE